MRAGALPAAFLSALALGLTGCAVEQDTRCADAYADYLRYGELEVLHEQAAAAAAPAEPPGLGSDRSREARDALAAQAAGLQLVLDNPDCFSTWQVREARRSLPGVREQLAEHGSG